MLREVKDARWECRRSVAGRRWRLVRGARASTATWSTRRLRAMRMAQVTEPVALIAEDGRVWWWFGDRIWWEDAGLGADDVLALVRERDRRDERRLERAHAALAGERTAPRRTAIPGEVRRTVWERDGGRCVDCGAAFDLQYDHVIPVALGGASTVENLQVLCAPCNRRKGAALA